MTSTTARWHASLMSTYAPPALTLVRGEGAVVWDEEGRVYVDLVAGLAVNALGHAHPRVVEAVTRQVSTLGHVSNLYANPLAVELAERLLGMLGREGRVFFCNSGAEANEAALKLSRRTGRIRILAAEGGFHGRTMGALALTGQPAKRQPFLPLPGEVTFVPYGDAAALRAGVHERTAAVVLEPVQGENGVVPAPDGYLEAAGEATRDVGALLVLDEVQTGIGRTGTWFAHQATGARPDVVTLAKGLGGGLPIGACVALGDAAGLLGPGSHGSTFGGNPVVCAAALAVLDTIEDEGLLERAKELGRRLTTGVEDLAHPLVAGVRGRGLMLAVLLRADVAARTAAALAARGFLVNAVTPRALRLVPPLVLSDEQADAFLAALPSALDEAGEGRVG